MPHPREAEPWLRTAKKEAKTTMPFLFGFAVVGIGVLRLTAGLTEHDLKQSKMINPRGSSH